MPLSARRSTVLILLWLLCTSLSIRAADEVEISLKSDPPIERIEPNTKAAKLSILLRYKDGRPVESARLNLELDSPPRNAFFSTGFPIAEGTPLIRSEAVATDGKWEFSFLFPMRGAYRMKVAAEPLADGPKFNSQSKEMAIQINEEPAVVRNFSILIALLIGFGLISGLVLGRSARASHE